MNGYSSKAGGMVDLADTKQLNDLMSIMHNQAALLQKAEVELYDEAVRAAQRALDKKVEAQAKALKRIRDMVGYASKEEVEQDKKKLEEKIKDLQTAEQAEIDAIHKDIQERAKAIKRKRSLDAAQKKEQLDALAAELIEREQAVRDEAAAEIKIKQDQLDELGKITDEQLKKNAKKAEKIRKQEEKKDKNRDKAEKKKEQRQKQKELESELSSALFSEGKTMSERFSGIREAYYQAHDMTGSTGKSLAALSASLVNTLGDLTTQLNDTIEEIAGKKTAIDTRLQGSKNKTSGGSYWDQISKDIVGAAGISPLVKQQDIVNNVEAAVSRGIAFDVEQRAFLQTIKDKIASTFNAFDGSLLRLIRIQQADSTAARLGMESALNTFLNQMYETSEYLSDLAEGVRSSLLEAQALMGATAATELEFEVQKWLGSMYSVGMSNSGVNAIADALGRVAAGDITGITSGGASNLVVMAANEAGLSIAEILAKGLNGDTANTLMEAMVNYLSKIYAASQNSNVVQQQMAKVYGLTASDLKSITNIITANNSSVAAISNTTQTYNDMMNQLSTMASSMSQRVSMGEKMTNLWSNVKYSMAAGIANNPALYAIYKIAGLLDSVAGGIDIPLPLIMGSGLNYKLNVADLMRVAALSGGILSSLGQIIGGGGGLTGEGMLKAFDISGLKTVSRGKGSGLKSTSGKYVSESGSQTIGNADSSSIKDKTLADASDENEATMAAAKSKDDAEWTLRDLHRESLLKMHEDIIASVAELTKIQTNTANIASTIQTAHSSTSTNIGASIDAQTENVLSNSLRVSLANDDTSVTTLQTIATSTSDIYNLLKEVLRDGVVKVQLEGSFGSNGNNPLISAGGTGTL